MIMYCIFDHVPVGSVHVTDACRQIIGLLTSMIITFSTVALLLLFEAPTLNKPQ